MGELFAAFGINWKLLLVQALNFGALLFVLWYFLYEPVLKMLDDRRKKIAEGVQNAEEAARRLADAKAKGQGIIGEASREGESIVAAARNRAEVKAEEIVKAAESRAEVTLKDASARAEEAKRQALKESEREIARAAMLAAEKILREKHS
ncbi:F0F1 ATP synthase subunit B [Candidatus Kaiserbacteria bacterium]|nr:F0F1 ATP synthase subunit B [Candidatus Kaiserbacteria bacterium]